MHVSWLVCVMHFGTLTYRKNMNCLVHVKSKCSCHTVSFECKIMTNI